MWFVHDGPRSPTNLQTSSTGSYEIVVFTHPNKSGGTHCSVYNRSTRFESTKEWKYTMEMAPGKPVNKVRAWKSDDGNRILVVFSDCYFISNLKAGTLEQSAFINDAGSA